MNGLFMRFLHPLTCIFLEINIRFAMNIKDPGKDFK